MAYFTEGVKHKVTDASGTLEVIDLIPKASNRKPEVDPKNWTRR